MSDRHNNEALTKILTRFREWDASWDKYDYYNKREIRNPKPISFAEFIDELSKKYNVFEIINK